MNQVVVISTEDLKQLISECLREILSKNKIPDNGRLITAVEDQLLTSSQACCLLKISKPTLIRYKKERKISFINAGRSHLFSKNELIKTFKNEKVEQ